MFETIRNMVLGLSVTLIKPVFKMTSAPFFFLSFLEERECKKKTNSVVLATRAPLVHSFVLMYSGA